jgi:hypothetical protein
MRSLLRLSNLPNCGTMALHDTGMDASPTLTWSTPCGPCNWCCWSADALLLFASLLLLVV